MNTIFDFLYAIPFPHILATITTATTITIFALLSGYWLIIPCAYIALFSYTLYQQKPHYIFVLFLCVLFSTGAALQIKHLYQQYRSHQELFGQAMLLEGRIIQINDSKLAKEQTTILLQTTNAYRSIPKSLSCAQRQQDINNQIKPLKLSQNILIYLPTKRAQSLKEGQTIAIYNLRLSQPEHGCAYESYLIKENIWATAFIASNRIAIKQYATLPLHKKCFNLFTSHLNKSTASLYNPLFLGKREKNLCTISIQHNSMYWGIAHHMARSGIHLVTIFGLLMTFLHYLRVRPSYRYFLGTILSIGYFEITFPSISFIRALFMILFQMFSKMNKFTYSSIHALTLTTLIIIMHNPLQILFLDFQLSFGVTYIIIWLFRAKYAKNSCL